MGNTMTNNSVYKPVQAKLIHRIAAFILDAILFVVLFTGVLYFASLISKYNHHYQNLHDEYIKIGYEIVVDDEGNTRYIDETDINFNEVKEKYNASEIIKQEETFINSFALNAPMISILLSLLILEIIIPSIFRNGQTIGMKCFHIGLLANTNLAIKPVQVFIRGLFGKIVILSLITYMGLFYAFFNPAGGLLGLLIVLVVVIGNTSLLIFTKKHVGIQDIIAQTYPVDSSQTIFYRTEEEFKKAIKEERNYSKNKKKVY